MCVTALAGCIGAPGIPGGPLQGTGFSASGSYGYALAPARITLRRRSDGQTDSYVDPAADAVNLPIFPSRLGGRVGLTKWFDAAADLSPVDAGLELRGGLPEGATPFPMALSIAVRDGSWGVLQTENRRSSEQRVRFEAYPRLALLDSLRVNLISSLGVSTGRRFHPAQLPQQFQDPTDAGEGVPGPNFDPQLLRDETRVEGSVGVEMRQNHFFLSAVLMPYVVASSKQLSAKCDECSVWQVQSFDSGFGAALFISAGLSFTLSDLEKVR